MAALGSSGSEIADGARRRAKVRVLIVDDSRTIRTLIRTILAEAPDIDVVGEATDAFHARDLIKELSPDVVTLDVEMPRMDGLQFLERLMRLRPMPVVMVSSRTTENSHAAIRALSLGAVECVDIAKLNDLQTNGIDLAGTIMMAAASRPQVFRKAASWSGTNVLRPDFRWNGKLVLIGASTGGVDALITLLSEYPPDGPPTAIAQHMPPRFLESFAARLDRHSPARVTLARSGMQLHRGMVAVAPGGTTHLALSDGSPFMMTLVPSTGQSVYTPSVEVLFSSAVPYAATIVAVMLTGMGSDGAKAMARLREAGAHTIVQDSETSVVDGMPRAARAAGAAAEVVPLPNIAQRILANSTLNKEMPK